MSMCETHMSVMTEARHMGRYVTLPTNTSWWKQLYGNESLTQYTIARAKAYWVLLSESKKLGTFHAQ